MRIKQVLAALVAVLLLGALAPPVASAQYGVDVANARVSRSRVCQGECVVFSGDGFRANSTVTITDNGRVVATVRTNAAGRFTYQLCFDDDAAVGRHEIRGTGVNPQGGARVVRAFVDVCAKSKSGAGGKGLTRTGTDVLLPALGMGFLLVLIGAVALFLARRRHRVSTT